MNYTITCQRTEKDQTYQPVAKKPLDLEAFFAKCYQGLKCLGQAKNLEADEAAGFRLL